MLNGYETTLAAWPRPAARRNKRAPSPFPESTQAGDQFMAESTIANRDDDLAVEVARLKREIANLKGAIAERAGDIAQGASRAADVVTQPIRNNPGTAGMLFGALVGL